MGSLRVRLPCGNPALIGAEPHDPNKIRCQSCQCIVPGDGMSNYCRDIWDRATQKDSPNE